MECVKPSGKLKCGKCKLYHNYYGCLSKKTFGRGFVQIDQKKDKNFVQIDYKQILDK